MFDNNRVTNDNWFINQTVFMFVFSFICMPKYDRNVEIPLNLKALSS